ncbi:hypothetical protein HRG_014069 [Hirsutella rhossiliensis]
MPREQTARVSPEEVRRTLKDLQSQRRPQPVRVPNDEILRVLQDMDRQRAEDRTRRREAQYRYTAHAAANHSITETTWARASASPPPPTEPALPKDPGRCEKPFNFNETLSNPYCITITPLSASRSRHHQQDPGATMSPLPSR